MNGRRWTSAEAMQLTGATYRQVDYWSRIGLLGEDTAKGSGSVRTFTHTQLQQIQVMVAGTKAKIPPRPLAAALAAIPYLPERETFSFVLRPGVTVVIRIRPLYMGVAA